MQKELFKKIKSIDWIRGAEREMYLISMIASVKTYTWDFRKMKIINQRYSLCIEEKGMWTIFRPKNDFDKVLKSIIDQLSIAPHQVKHNLEVLEKLNQTVDNFSRRNLKNLKTTRKKIDFLNKLEDLTNNYWPPYLYNAFLGYSCEKFKKTSRFLKKVRHLKDIPNYLKIENIFRKFTGHIGLDKNLAEHYTFSDLRYFLLKNKNQEIKQRRQKILLFGEKQKIYIITKNVSEIQHFLKKKEKAELNLESGIKGISTYKEISKGKVVVIRTPKEYGKVKKGDILVIPMTRPDIVPYLRHIKGIVTDEGGLLCHAAIISRELKIPCIVGTKIATQALKDGDFVEVDADKGIVRIIKKIKEKR